MPDSTRAIIYLIATMFLMTAMDAAAKYTGQHGATFMALWARYAGQMVLVALINARHLRRVVHTAFPALQALRSALMLGATVFFYLGLRHLGLAESTAIADISPVLITLGAAVLLRESIGPKRIAGIIMAVFGAMIVIRPGSSVFSYAALLPLAAAVCYSGFALTTRFIGLRESPWSSLFHGSMLGTVVLSCLIPWQWHPPSADVILTMCLIAVLGTTGQLCMVRAFSLGEAAMLAPFGYVDLLMATCFGLAVFGDIPDPPTILGSLVIAASGVYVWHRETRSAGQNSQAAGAARSPSEEP